MTSSLALRSSEWASWSVQVLHPWLRSWPWHTNAWRNNTNTRDSKQRVFTGLLMHTFAAGNMEGAHSSLRLPLQLWHRSFSRTMFPAGSHSHSMAEKWIWLRLLTLDWNGGTTGNSGSRLYENGTDCNNLNPELCYLAAGKRFLAYDRERCWTHLFTQSCTAWAQVLVYAGQR